jgi:hypothetical protein
LSLFLFPGREAQNNRERKPVPLSIPDHPQRRKEKKEAAEEN